MENVTFHSLLRWKVIILQILATSLISRFLKGWENGLFELRSERVKISMAAVSHPLSTYHVSNSWPKTNSRFGVALCLPPPCTDFPEPRRNLGKKIQIQYFDNTFFVWIAEALCCLPDNRLDNSIVWEPICSEGRQQCHGTTSWYS